MNRARVSAQMDRFCRTDPVLTGQKFRKRCRRVKEHELGGNNGQPGSYRFVRRISTEKRARVQWGDLPIWTMLFVTAIGGRLHDKEQAQADAQRSPSESPIIQDPCI